MSTNLQNSNKHTIPSNDTALYDAVSNGMLMLLARGVNYPPPRDEIGPRAKVLVEDLKAEGLTDPVAATNVFNTIGRTFSDWPSTALILSMLRPKQEPLMHKMLQHEKNKVYTDQEKQNFRVMIAEAKKRLGWKPERKLTEAEEAALLEEARVSFSENKITAAKSEEP